MTKALLSIGSNLGDRLENLRRAVEGLGSAVVSISPVYETPAWPPGDVAPKYLNAVILVEDDGRDAYGWLNAAHELEQPTIERTRNPAWQFPARTLDIDVIMVWDNYGQPIISDDPRLTLPHPRTHLRVFVLKLWKDIQPDGTIPGRGTVTQLLKTETLAADLSKIRRYPAHLNR